MNYKKWLEENTEILKDKLVAVTGTTGGLGRELVRFLCELNANIILLDRNETRSENFRQELLELFPQVKIERITVDLENFESVKSACEQLKRLPIDVFFHNAGAYSIPRKKTDLGFDNVFQINFVSPYYIVNQLLPILRERKGKVVAVGSIAHNYSKTDLNDIDFSTHTAASKVYGNAKRYLMFSLFELFNKETEVSLSIVHPGITFTNITAHYPKLIFAVIKHPMKLIFMKPKVAALCLIKGIFQSTEYHTWIGPRFFNIWGKPNVKRLKTCHLTESKTIGQTAKKIYEKIN